MVRYGSARRSCGFAALSLHRVLRGALRFAILCGVVGPGASAAVAAPAVVLGDSIGVGVSMAGGVPRLAHNSVSIRSADVLRQLQRLSPGTVAILSLGTNDAVGSIAGVERGVDKILRAARSADLRLVWLGPPCVLKPWNSNVVKLDALLARRLAGQVPYVSIADEQLCDKSLRGRDGVHFNMRGYSILWARARAAAGVGIEAGSIEPVIRAEPKSVGREPKPYREGRRGVGDMPVDVASDPSVPLPVR